jgi:hypothetical protein
VARLHDDICDGAQPGEDIAAFGCSLVADETALVRIARQPRQATVYRWKIVRKWRLPAPRIAPRRFHLDDIRPQIGQRPPAQVAAGVGQIQDAQAVKH